MNKNQLYVLGFAFTHDGRVALIRKNRPAWQAGKLNGIGGKVEESENASAAMAREFYEETGVKIPEHWWEFRGRMFGGDWSVFVYTVSSEDIAKVKTMTDEEVILLPFHGIHHSGTVLDRNGTQMVENVQALIHLTQIPAEPPSHVKPRFELNYRWPIL